MTLVCPDCDRTIYIFGMQTTIVPQAGGSTSATYLEPMPAPDRSAEHAREFVEVIKEARARVAAAQTGAEKIAALMGLKLAPMKAYARTWGVEGLRDVRLGCRCGFVRTVAAMDLHRRVFDAHEAGETRIAA